MAFLGDAVFIHNESSLLGLNQDIRENNIISSLGKRKISILNAQDHKIEHDWSLKTSQHLTCAAIVDHRSTSYHAVVNKQILKSWNRDDLSIDKATRLTLPKEACRLLSWPDTQPIIVYTDGTLAFLDNPENIIGDGPPGTLHWCGSKVIDSQPNIILLFQRDDNWIVYVHQVTKSSEICTSKIVSLTYKDDVKPISFDLLLHCRDIRLVILWENGDVTETSLLSTGITKMTSHVDSCGSRSVIAVIDKDHIAVTGEKQHQQGLCIWETKFQIMQAWKPFADDNKSPIKIHQCWGRLYISSNKGVQQFTYSVQCSSLKAALGKVAAESADSKVVKICKECSILELIDTNKSDSYEKFKSVFRKFINWCKNHKAEVVLLQGHIRKLIERCISEKNAFWPLSELQQMIQAGVIYGSDCGGLVAALVEKDELATLFLCVTQLKDLEESHIVTCLQYFMSVKEEELNSVLVDEVDIPEEEDSDVTCPWQSGKAACIDKILNLPYNDVFMVECLRKLDFGSTLELLKYVQYSLHSSLVANTQTDKPSLEKLVDWVGLLLDSHYTQVVLSSSAIELLLGLHNTIQNKLELCSELQTLEALLTQLKEKAALPVKQDVGSYCIQTLHIL